MAVRLIRLPLDLHPLQRGENPKVAYNRSIHLLLSSLQILFVSFQFRHTLMALFESLSQPAKRGINPPAALLSHTRTKSDPIGDFVADAVSTASFFYHLDTTQSRV